MRALASFRLSLFLIFSLISVTAIAAQEIPQPVIDGPWWSIAGNPDLGSLGSPEQQPVDFGVWQAADGTWQLWSCIRKTNCGGKTRLFHRWEGKSPTDTDWQPKGVVMQADPALGETEGGLQAPHVVRVGDTYHMFYGDWQNICHAVSQDGKSFQRVIQPHGKTGLFSEGNEGFARDMMMLPVGEKWHGYYTANPSLDPEVPQAERQGAIYLRTTRDFQTWSPSTTVAFGGISGTLYYSAECPHVVEHAGRYYLFRTQLYGKNQITNVYHSTDPAQFGINQDHRYLRSRLPIAAPEIVNHEGETYLFALNAELDGIRAVKLRWE